MIEYSEMQFALFWQNYFYFPNLPLFHLSVLCKTLYVEGGAKSVCLLGLGGWDNIHFKILSLRASLINLILVKCWKVYHFILNHFNSMMRDVKYKSLNHLLLSDWTSPSRRLSGFRKERRRPESLDQFKVVLQW